MRPKPTRRLQTVRGAVLAVWLLALLLPALLAATSARASDETAPARPARVEFPSADGRTTLTGYLFSPEPSGVSRHAAIVMMHGRAGAYSSRADGRFDADTLSKRHVFWGRFWAARGYAALLVDGFGPRGYPQGFKAHTYDARPDALNEVEVRPLDAYGALAYLRGRPDIDPSRIALQGWSNGGSATIATMSDATLAAQHLAPSSGFKAAIAFYPACGLHGRYQADYRPYAPLLIFGGDADEEVSAAHCRRLVEAARPGSDLRIQIFPGATHDFDDPGQKRQSVPANAVAAGQAIDRAGAFLDDLLRR